MGLSKFNHKHYSLWDTVKIIQYKGQLSLKVLEHHITKSSCRHCRRLNISYLFSSGAQTLSEELKFGVKKLEKSTADQGSQMAIMYNLLMHNHYKI